MWKFQVISRMYTVLSSHGVQDIADYTVFYNNHWYNAIHVKMMCHGKCKAFQLFRARNDCLDGGVCSGVAKAAESGKIIWYRRGQWIRKSLKPVVTQQDVLQIRKWVVQNAERASEDDSLKKMKAATKQPNRKDQQLPGMISENQALAGGKNAFGKWM